MALAVTNVQSWSDISVDKSYNGGSGSDRVLVVVVGIAFSDSNTISGVTYNGVSLTALTTTQNDPYDWASVRVFYLINPATGSNTLAFNTTDDTVANAIATILTGANTASPVGTAAKANGDSASSSVTVNQSASGNLLVAGVTNGTDNASITGTGGSTVQGTNPGAAFFKLALVSKPTTGAGTLAIATSNTSDGWAIMAAEFRATVIPSTSSATTLSLMGV